ncbi:glycosyltransferase [Solidesulfovibrio sp.]|uniref:glycosyltransferase n=1 Tax=Solidesulfovibrio sp. TaxID=2910990 RepID=UPI00260DE627|nr:glycosyltransferase [Solidesulfovibrio sp.]
MPDATSAHLPVDVVVPVYKGHALTRACLESILAAANRAPCRVVVVNDRSPEPELTDSLRKLAASGRVLLLENARNLGFPATANRGLALSPGHDRVLVNSDVVVFDGWLDRLAAAVHAAPDIGTATPFSNNATICSYPLPNRDNPLPADIDAAGLDALFAAQNAGRAVDLPTAVGFCLYIRGACLEETGLFDADAFGTGYGEENDFCLRAARLGWRHVLAGDVFAVHAGGASFGKDKDPALARNLAVLAARHPGYLAAVAAFTRADPVAPLRRAVDVARLRHADAGPLVVRLCHAKDGGTARRLADEAKELTAANYLPATLVPADRDAPDAPGARVRLGLDHPEVPAELVYDLSHELPLLVADLQALGIVGCIFHHFLDLPPQLLDLPGLCGVPHEARIHDYGWFCPSINCIDDSGRCCGEPDTAACQRCADVNGTDMPHLTVEALLDQSARLLGTATRVTAPSADAAGRVARRFPAARVEVVPHPEPPFAPPPRPAILPWDGATEIQLAVVGAIGEHKGYGVLLAMARDANRRGLPLRFLVAGHTRDDYPLFATGKTFVSGRYHEEDAVDVIRELDCHAALFLSVWPETWCYTLTEAWRAGLWAVGFDLGAVGERIAATGFGWRLPPTRDGGAVNDRLLALFRSPPRPGALVP